jgi:hypothetical protein
LRSRRSAFVIGVGLPLPIKRQYQIFATLKTGALLQRRGATDRLSPTDAAFLLSFAGLNLSAGENFQAAPVKFFLIMTVLAPFKFINQNKNDISNQIYFWRKLPRADRFRCECGSRRERKESPHLRQRI